MEVMSTLGSPSLSLEEQEEETEGFEEECGTEEDDGIESFRDWMGFVSRCLKGRLTEEDAKSLGLEEDEDETCDDDEPEPERSMRIVRSVLDEETTLDMIKTFLQLAKVIREEG